jgi:hypothetical protein
MRCSQAQQLFTNRFIVWWQFDNLRWSWKTCCVVQHAMLHQGSDPLQFSNSIDRLLTHGQIKTSSQYSCSSSPFQFNFPWQIKNTVSISYVHKYRFSIKTNQPSISMYVETTPRLSLRYCAVGPKQTHIFLSRYIFWIINLHNIHI